MWEVFKLRKKNKWSSINSKEPALNRGNEMDLQLVHLQVAKQKCCLFDGLCTLRRRKGGVRAEVLWKTRFIFDCVSVQRRQNVYFTCSGILPPLF